MSHAGAGSAAESDSEGGGMNVFFVTAIKRVDDIYVVIDAESGETYGQLSSLEMVGSLVRSVVQDAHAQVIADVQ
ncbi:hypothetical protein [Caballeronia humi]|nr:hypothetical protein [Caballeronia humi]